MLSIPQTSDLQLPNLPPGIFGTPVIGEIREFAADPIAYMWDRYHRYGPIFKTHLGGPLVFVIGPEANKFVLHDRPDCFSFSQGVAPYVRIMFGDEPYSLKDGEPWRRLRQLTSPAFSPETLAFTLETIRDAGEQRLQDWAENSTVTCFPAIKSLLFETIWVWLTGQMEDPDRKQLLHNLYEAFVAVPEVREGNLGAVRDNSVKRLRRAKLEAGVQLQRQINAIVATRRDNPSQDVLSQWIQAQDKNGEGLSDKEIAAHALLFTVAGSDATAATLTWFLYALSRHPEVKAKAQAEIDAVVGDNPFTWEHHTKLPYLSCVFKEIERVHSPAFGGTRKIVKPFEFNGYTIPAGWSLRMCTFVSHHLPEVFEHPERFDPERFAPPREEDKRTQFSLIGFGGGQRICAGKPYAMLFLLALAVNILRDYNWKVLEDQDLSPMLHNRATFIPKSKLKLIFFPRVKAPSVG